MQNRYSPSKIKTFDTCRLQYKYRYIDRLRFDIKTIESFMGSMVHEALELLYKSVKGGRVESLDWLLNKYREVWDKNYEDNIKIVKKEFTSEDYFNKGKQCLKDYYEKYKPFNQSKIVDTERMIRFEVKYNEHKRLFNGILDRLDWNDNENIFEVHDYKTSNTLMTQEEADNDWQLGLYHVALKEIWPDVEKVKLVWHFLSFNKEIVSSRTKEQLKELQVNVIKKVKEIESCSNFFAKKSGLCDYCDFQNICPLWKHPKEMEKLDANKYKEDSGVKLVAEYEKLEEEKNELKEEISRIEGEQEKIKEAAIEFAEKNKVSVIDGAGFQLKVDVREELRAPTRSEDAQKWESLRDVLKREGKYEEVSTVNGNMLNYRIRLWAPELIDKISGFLVKKRIEAVRLIKKL